MSEQIGPTTRQVNHTERRCGACKYHENHLVKSGMEPVREHYCSHEKSKENLLPIHLFIHAMEGRLIGFNDETPDWCPVLEKNRKGAKL